MPAGMQDQARSHVGADEPPNMRIKIARLIVVQAQLVVKALGGVAVAGGRNVFRVPLLAPRVVPQPGTDATVGIEDDVDAARACRFTAFSASSEPVERWSIRKDECRRLWRSTYR